MLTAKAESHRSQIKRRDLNLIAFCLQSLLSLIRIYFRYLFALTTFFLAGETSRALALSLAFTARASHL